jgi:7-keto-8-aminopelargonate synthetase-like enzyme
MPQSCVSLPSAPSLVTVDDAFSPLLVVKFGRGSEQDLDAYLTTRAAYLRREQPHIVLFDARQVHMLSARVRQRYTDWLRAHEEKLRQWTLGTAYVVESPTVRMMMSVIRHFTSMASPFIVTATLPPAAVWAADRLSEAGMAQAATLIRVHYGVPLS